MWSEEEFTNSVTENSFDYTKIQLNFAMIFFLTFNSNVFPRHIAQH